VDLWKIRISSLYSIDKLLFPSILIFSFLLYLPISSISQIIKELCYTSSYSFHLLSVLQWHHEGGNLFSENYQSNWIFYTGHYLEVCSSLSYIQELHYLLSLTISSSPFSSSTSFQKSPNTSALIFLASMSLKHIMQCSKHNT